MPGVNGEEASDLGTTNFHPTYNCGDILCTLLSSIA